MFNIFVAIILGLGILSSYVNSIPDTSQEKAKAQEIAALQERENHLIELLNDLNKVITPVSNENPAKKDSVSISSDTIKVYDDFDLYLDIYSIYLDRSYIDPNVETTAYYYDKGYSCVFCNRFDKFLDKCELDIFRLGVPLDDYPNVYLCKIIETRKNWFVEFEEIKTSLKKTIVLDRFSVQVVIWDKKTLDLYQKIYSSY